MQPARVLDFTGVRDRSASAMWPGIGLIVLGVAIVYLVGFLSLPQAHNATHDTRHAAGFPCH